MIEWSDTDGQTDVGMSRNPFVILILNTKVTPDRLYRL